MASTRLYKVYSGATGTNAQKKWTVSVWVKKQKNGVKQTIAGGYRSSNGFACELLQFSSSDQLKFFSNSDAGNSATYFLTNAKYTDANGWYHIVQNVDTTQSTQSERFKMWVNGEQITSWSSSTYPVQDDSLYWGMNTDVEHQIGAINSSDYWNGLMSHFHFIQNETHAPTVFGETDTTTGEWKIKTNVTGVNYTGRSFFIFKDSNSYTDQSGNNNTWTLSGTLTKTEDCPSNVFCTWNPLNSYYGGGTFSWGNNKIVLPNKNGAWNTGTLGMTSGKYYWEVKVGGDHNGTEVQLGIADKSPIGNAGSTAGKAFGYSSNGEYGIYVYNGAFIGNAVANPYTSYGSGAGDGYIMIAVDLDNNKFYGGANGTWFGSGDPSNGTNGKTIQAVADTVDGCYYPAVSTYQGYTGTIETNFGNGYFADNAVSSAGTNASGNGIFEYAVPTGFTALSTKGLNL